MGYSYRDFNIYDAHAHIYPEKIAVKASQSIGNFYGLPARHSGDCGELLENGRKYGVKGYLVSSVATVPAQVKFINDYIAQNCREHREFFGFGAMHPEFRGIEQETGRLVSLGLRGIKLHPDFQRFNIDSREAYPIYKAAAEMRLPILFHMGDDRYDYSAPVRLARVLDDFPELVVIAAHLGGYRVWDRARGVLDRDNIWFDASSTLPLFGIKNSVEQIRYFGADRVFFGTDYPLWDYGEEIERFFTMDLTYDEYEKICCGNFLRFTEVMKWTTR